MGGFSSLRLRGLSSYGLSELSAVQMGGSSSEQLGGSSQSDWRIFKEETERINFKASGGLSSDGRIISRALVDYLHKRLGGYLQSGCRGAWGSGLFPCLEGASIEDSGAQKQFRIPYLQSQEYASEKLKKREGYSRRDRREIRRQRKTFAWDTLMRVGSIIFGAAGRIIFKVPGLFLEPFEDYLQSIWEDYLQSRWIIFRAA
ncbi:uncharacterized protein LOC121396023 [Xenopus laevis]|uniref:Uncharacterized protein LOC121396023 n=1 Tax=Xenopus laevis TaxID=8355 RepID=A0A8J1LAJ7_XENLA|nr:uncharacterized protein LOC121396023 [Xenopus laevis]